MGEIPLRSVQAGQWVSLESCGMVQVKAIDHRAEYVEIAWDRTGSPIPAHLEHAPRGTWSAYYADVPTVWLSTIHRHERT